MCIVDFWGSSTIKWTIHFLYIQKLSSDQWNILSMGPSYRTFGNFNNLWNHNSPQLQGKLLQGLNLKFKREYHVYKADTNKI